MSSHVRSLGATAPTAVPRARLEEVKARILAAIRSGPKTLGEIRAYHFRDLRAVVRDEAVAELHRDGRVRLTSIPNPNFLAEPLPALELAGGSEVGGA